MNRESLKVGLRMNKKNAEVMFNSRVQFEQIHVQGEALEVVDNFIYHEQLVQSNTSNEKKIKRRISLGWGAFGTRCSKLKGSLPLCLKRSLWPVRPPSYDLLIRNMDYNQITGEETNECPERDGKVDPGNCLRDRMRVTWIREQIKVEDILGTAADRRVHEEEIEGEIPGNWNTVATEEGCRLFHWLQVPLEV
ncbi:uncharacterized protein [Penaeus vannamei]|uniref:uncharacterized protein n=1 Tax=Penaeus vannamei TaxID=6689 RepID=UPI00387FB0A4